MEPQRVDPNLGMPMALPTTPGSTVPADMQLPQNQQTVSGASASSTPAIAEDSEIIEQEWVAAVQRTLEQYKDDPYSLSQAMTALRQDYLQKRYGRTVEAAK